jgi:hypothetical protein
VHLVGSYYPVKHKQYTCVHINSEYVYTVQKYNTLWKKLNSSPAETIWNTFQRMHVLHYEQDRQCTYNVTLRRVPAITVAVEKQWVLHKLSVCICSLRYPACNAHAPYCRLLPAPLYNNFPRYLIKGTTFEKKILNTLRVFWISLKFCLKYFSF